MKIFSVIMSMLMLASCTLSAKNHYPAEYLEKTTWHEVHVDNWTGIIVQGVYTVEVKIMPDSAGILRVLANDAMMRDLDARTDGVTLKIGMHQHKKNCNRKAAPLIIAYSNGNLSQATLQGSGDILLSSLKTNTQLNLLLQGSGDIELTGASVGELDALLQGSGDINVWKLKATTVNGSVKGSGDIDLHGSTKTLNLVLQGSGDIDAANMKADEIKANAIGTGGITIGHATKVDVKGKNIRQSKKIKH